MKFTCEKAVLNEAISICIHAVATKSTIAVLEGLLITAEDELIERIMKSRNFMAAYGCLRQ